MGDFGNDDIWAAAWTHRERLLRIARTRVATAADAEDCVHDAIIRCVVARDVDITRLGALLTTITIRLCIDLHRSQVRAARALSRLESTRLVSTPADDDAVCERIDAVRAAPSLDVLAARERQVIEARAAGLGPHEAAKELGLTVKAAESAYTRARAKMREQAGLGSSRFVA